MHATDAPDMRNVYWRSNSLVWHLRAGLGRSQNIPADAAIEQVQTVLAEDFPSLGRILVVREEYVYCTCNGSYIWTVTFDEVRGYERSSLSRVFVAPSLWASPVL